MLACVAIVSFPRVWEACEGMGSEKEQNKSRAGEWGEETSWLNCKDILSSDWALEAGFHQCISININIGMKHRKNKHP